MLDAKSSYWINGDGKDIKRTIANLSHWDPQLIEHFRVLLKGGVAVESAQSVMTLERSLPHGHVAAVLGTARQCGIEKLLAAAPESVRSLVLALVVARVPEPGSKLATWRMLRPQCATHSLSAVLGIGEVEPDDLYRALDWLGDAQPRIERQLAHKHLTNGVLVLYDLSSTWVTGRHCALAKHGYSRGHVKQTLLSSSANFHAQRVEEDYGGWSFTCAHSSN